ncbi:MAG TPA: MFS transporter [Mycobacteriales bacterium]|nr:MFS transporter [Mycobacteriales bacterium]
MVPGVGGSSTAAVELGDAAAVAIAEEAILEGDVAIRPGTARSALRSRDMRRLWLSMVGSNIGTWMQNVALGAYAYNLTHSASFVSVVFFAQLGPVLVLAPFAGLLADAVDRRKLLVITNLEQLVFSGLLSLVAAAHHPSKAILIMVVVAIGVGNALSGPPLSSLLPNLVPREDLPGAISLQSIQMNLSRVIGPAIGGLLLSKLDASGLFALTASTYLFAVVGVLSIKPVRQPAVDGGFGVRRLLGGFAVARRDPLIRRSLLTIASLSLFCLPFVGLIPVLAAQNLGLDVKSAAYGWLYACFGLGAMSGAIAVGSVLAGRPRAPVIAGSLALFGIVLAGFSLLRHPGPAYPLIFVVGLFYFSAVTSLSTQLQENLEDATRGRVMALYMMGFGGTVPIGVFAGGHLVNATSITDVVFVGGVIALLLAWAVRPRRASGSYVIGLVEQSH